MFVKLLDLRDPYDLAPSLSVHRLELREYKPLSCNVPPVVVTRIELVGDLFLVDHGEVDVIPMSAVKRFQLA